MKTNLSFLVVLLLALSLNACATITRGSKDTLVIETDPPNADVLLSSGQVCKTPCSIKLPRKDNCVVKIKKSGFTDVNVNVTAQISGAGGAGMAGNILLGGIIGGGVDLATGAMYDLKPNPIKVNLEKSEILTINNEQEP